MRTPLESIDTTWRNLYMYIWANWDGGHYVSIAAKGYELFQYAFFPLFPFLIKTTHTLIGNEHSYIFAGLLVSRTSLLIALIYVYKLFRLEVSEDTAQKALFFTLAFPTSIFLMAVYTEPLFIALSAASLYYARNKQWVVAGGATFLAALTRTVGVALLFPLLYEYFISVPTHSIKHKLKRALTDWRFYFCFLSILGVLTYFTYLYGKTGNFFQMFEAQKHWSEVANRGGDGLNSPLSAITKAYTAIETFDVSPQYIIPFLDLVPTLFFIVKVIMSIKFSSLKIPFSYNLFSLGVLIIPLFQGSTQSMFRYIVVAFPVFLILAKIGEKSTLFFYVWLGLSLILYSNALQSFIFGWWVG